MCTLTWRQEPDGYSLFFNRDERNSRAPGLPPRQLGEAVRWIAPLDGDFGGTWISVNELGLTVGLMNGAPGNEPRGGDPRSRGLLVRELAESDSSSALVKKIAGMELSAYRPFRLFAIDPRSPIVLVKWTGELLKTEETRRRPPITSSFIEESEVGERRRAEYERLLGESFDPPLGLLEKYHRSHFPERGAYSVCMHREEAGTQSMTRIDVTPEEARLVYHAGPPCTEAMEYTLSLKRREASS
jgi:hypothetical protein